MWSITIARNRKLDLQQAIKDDLIWAAVVLTRVGKCRKLPDKRQIAIQAWSRVFSAIKTDSPLNKGERKPKWQSRMDNPEKRATLSTHYTGWRQPKQKTKHRKLKRLVTRTPSHTRGELGCSQRISSSCLLQDTHHITHLVKTCWTPLYTNTINMTSSNNWGSRRTEYRFHAEIVACITTRNLKHKYVFIVCASF
jgi:hypothetical protein